jgi:predicted 2-oxoglutarate/Fe(II)-dependent dioxygenase YbiX
MRSDATAFVVPACLRCVEALPREPSCDVTMPAPVLVLPHLLTRAMCDQLIERFESSPTVDGGIASIDRDGRPCTKVDHSKKHRRDMLISPDDPLHDPVRAILLDCCAPEMAKAFHAEIRHIDRLLLARYDAPGGKFLRHRDNRGKNVAFREFALSVNLRREAFDGGHVSFPEYNDHRYAAPTGTGMIFSSSLLHEATEVTRGHRYVLLTFLHGDAAEARRLAYEAEMVGIG